MHAQILSFTQTCKDTHVHVFVCMYRYFLSHNIYIGACVCVYTHTLTHTHTHLLQVLKFIFVVVALAGELTKEFVDLLVAV